MNRHSYCLIKVLFVALAIAQATTSCASSKAEKYEQGVREDNTMVSESENCKSNRLLRSQKLVNFIFDDINKTYPHTGGGGITSIKEIETNTFEVSIAQEERMDVLTYRLDINETCHVTLNSKQESTINFGG